ncbi:protein DMP3-like [Carya illinoinensis]|uniref:Uncharacterized protein n=1 Tax=Carya illinoinensis TaxID=32201 RepID=A0A8T1QDF2_CARIL|nr:protein DMP3-like [Carya illinoinensis]KAG6652421.1 hypothetical protein CIPAW_05G005100 [Carya illinoinensis]
MSNLRPRSTSKNQSSTADKPAPPIPSPLSSDTDPDTPIKAPLLRQKSFSQRAISQTLEGTANLAKLLPSGTLLAFQLLIPVFTQNGACDSATRPMTAILLVILAVSCFAASFTDTVKASDGQVYHGLATFKGMWLFDYPGPSNPSGLPNLSSYKIRFIDWVHAVLSVLVFGAVAMRDKNVLQCLYPTPGREIEEVLDIVPVGFGLICSLMFVVFPTRRNGIGYPVTPGK